MFLERDISEVLIEKSKQYPVVVITGPRQSGKSTLARFLFAHKPYVSLEDPDVRQFATYDPRAFLAQFAEGALLDEIQHCPDLFSYIQTIVDDKKIMGLFILTGSQQFGLNAKISQTLAGRAGIVQLLPFTFNELKTGQCAPTSLEEVLWMGGYPPIYDRKIPPSSWYQDYTLTYLERDVRQLVNVKDMRIFHLFLQMCAARTGQLLNLSSLAADCGITHNTAKAWISILETSYLIFLLPPYYRNFNKRLMKSPKLYFYDSGLICALLGIREAHQLRTHLIRGPLFETWVISEFIKHQLNQGQRPNLFFYRDSQGHEVDLIVDNPLALIPIEIKSGQTINPDYFTGIMYWQKNIQPTEKTYLLYGGDSSHHRQHIPCEIISWQNISALLQDT